MAAFQVEQKCYYKGQQYGDSPKKTIDKLKYLLFTSGLELKSTKLTVGAKCGTRIIGLSLWVQSSFIFAHQAPSRARSVPPMDGLILTFCMPICSIPIFQYLSQYRKNLVQ